MLSHGINRRGIQHTTYSERRALLLVWRLLPRLTSGKRIGICVTVLNAANVILKSGMKVGFPRGVPE
jgi:hypothetical protein